MQINNVDEMDHPGDLRHGLMNEPRSSVNRMDAEGTSNPLDIRMVETGGKIVVQTVIPGVEPADIDVQVDGDRLTISANVLDDYGSDDTLVHLDELIHGRYERSVSIAADANVDGVEASYKHGLLTVTFPKSHPGKKGRAKVPVKDALPGDKHQANIPVVRK